MAKTREQRAAGERFWSKVDKSGECWTWQATRRPFGYGDFWINGRMRKAHRVSWEMANGPVPPGMHVLHRCDNPPCVRPDHLFLGTNADNVRDAVAKGRAPVTSFRPGAGHRFSKLLDEDVRTIRRLRAAGVKRTDIAERFGITDTTVGDIARRRSWRHVG